MDSQLSDNAPAKPWVADAADLKVWLAYEYDDLRKEIAECRAALQSMVDKYPNGFPDDEVAGIAAENLSIVSAKLRAADERRLDESKPYRDGQKVINDWFGGFIVGPAVEARATVQTLQDRYGKEKLRKAQEAAEAAKEKAEQEARRTAELAAEAARAGRDDAHGLMEEAGRAADALVKATERAEHVVVRLRGPMDAVSSTTVRWGWELADFSEVPDFYKCIDEAKVREAGRKRGPGGRPVAEIPGIRWVSNTSMRSR